MSQMANTNREEVPRWNFKNSLRLNLKKLEKPLGHQELFKKIYERLNEIESSMITSIYNFSSNKIWIIEFNSSLDISIIFDRQIVINGITFKLEDANKEPELRRYCTFRFHFLPTNFNKQYLENYFKAFKVEGLKIEEISEETYKDSKIKNGVKRVKISYPKEMDMTIRNIQGPTKIYG